MIVAFTGHRKLGGYEFNPLQAWVKEQIKGVLIKVQADTGISGMALGVDQLAAEACIELMIPFIAAVPFLGQESCWPKQTKDKYFDLLSKAESKVIVCEGNYAAWKMQKRNQYMVDNSDILIAVYDGTSGGTQNCVNYANTKTKQIIFINPNDYKEP